jgi:hypothetical protein
MIEFTFAYQWLKDKQIIVDGTEYSGILIISDWDDNIIKMYGYERLETNEEE